MNGTSWGIRYTRSTYEKWLLSRYSYSSPLTKQKLLWECIFAHASLAFNSLALRHSGHCSSKFNVTSL